MAKKNIYLLIVDEGAFKIQAKNDTEALLRGSIGNFERKNELIDFLMDSYSFSIDGVKDFLNNYAGKYLSSETLRDFDFDSSHIFMNEIYLLYNITEDKQIFGDIMVLDDF